MKKKLLILAMCLFGALSANAATWVAVDSGNPDIQLFIDSESVKYLSTDTCTYALIYKKGQKPTKIVYAISNYSKDKVGIIRVEDFEPDEYDPGYYSKHPRAFMKDINSNAILRSAHNFALAMYHEKNTDSDISMNITNIKDVSNHLPSSSRFGFTEEEYQAYINNIKSAILSNWRTNINTVNTKVTLIISINSDGSYNGYRILQSSNNEAAKRSAIAAVNLTAPFASFPEGNEGNNILNLPITFEQKLIKKFVK